MTAKWVLIWFQILKSSFDFFVKIKKKSASLVYLIQETATTSTVRHVPICWICLNTKHMTLSFYSMDRKQKGFTYDKP